jgi:hypothetical protein
MVLEAEETKVGEVLHGVSGIYHAGIKVYAINEFIHSELRKTFSVRMW